jgi:hypothetical protein
MSEHLARALLPRPSAGTRRSDARATPTLDTVDRVLLTVAALATLLALWQLWELSRMGL